MHSPLTPSTVIQLLSMPHLVDCALDVLVTADTYKCAQADPDPLVSRGAFTTLMNAVARLRHYITVALPQFRRDTFFVDEVMDVLLTQLLTLVTPEAVQS